MDLDLDKEIEESEIVRCIKKLRNNKTRGGDGIVGELLKYIRRSQHGEDVE